MDFERIVEQLIQEARAQGKFDQLAGQGRPLPPDPTDASAEDWTANHLLKNEGFRPAWLEEDMALRAGLEQARAAGQRSWSWRQAELARLEPQPAAAASQRRAGVEAEWVLAQTRFRELVIDLNQRRRVLNLQVPSERLQRPLVDADLELRRLNVE